MKDLKSSPHQRGRRGETSKGYNTHLIVVGSEEADSTDDDSVSITGDMGNNRAGDEHVDRA